MPKTFTVRNNHHFGAWSKSFIISITIAFLITTISVGVTLHLSHENGDLKRDALNFWLIKALYPDVSQVVEKGLKEDPKSFIEHAEKEMARQHDILEAQAVKAQRSTVKKIEKLKDAK